MDQLNQSYGFDEGDKEKRISLYFPGQLNLNDGLVSSLGPAIAPAAAASSPASTLAPSATAPQDSSAAPPTAVASTATVSATAPAPAAGISDCSLEFAGNNSRLSFAQCQSLATSSSANTGIRFLWNLAPSPAGNGSLVTGALEASSPGWAGFGFPSSPGRMIGANALIVKPCSSCPSGASVDNYLLNGHDTADVVAGTGKLNVTGLEAAKTSSGALQATFELYLPEGVTDLGNPMNLIASVGPVSSNGDLQTHPIADAYSGTVNLASGAATIGGGGSGDKKPTIHGYLMIFGWGLLLPLGVVFARCKEWGPLWFHLHRFTQMLGYLTGMAGAGVAVAMGRQTRTHLEDVHRIIGLTVTIVLSIQVLSILWRPHPKASYRFVFNYYHWVMGGAAVLLACSNVFIGLNVAGEPTKWSGLYGAGFGLIVLMYFGKAALNVTVLAGKRRRLIGSSDDSDSLDEREKLGSKRTHANGTNGTSATV